MGPVTRQDPNQVYDVHEHSLQYLTVVLIRCFLPELAPAEQHCSICVLYSMYIHTLVHITTVLYLPFNVDEILQKI
jgi:hypothetical protein